MGAVRDRGVHRVPDDQRLSAAATRGLAVSGRLPVRTFRRLGVGPEFYSLWGSSAGARMAAAIGSYGTPAFGGGAHPRPAAVVMAYRGHRDVAPDEPSTFAAVGSRDGIAPPALMARRVATFRARGTEVEFRVVPDLGHGFGPGTGADADGRIGDAVAFWERAIPRRD